MSNISNWRGLICGAVGAVALFASTNSALAVSACSSFTPSLSTPVSAAFVSSTVVFRVSDTFVAGDVITFQSPSTSNIRINSFQIAQTSGFATIAILANFGVGGGSFSFTIPADGFFSFSMTGSGTNISFTAGQFTFLASCTSGGGGATAPATGGGTTTMPATTTNQETISQYKDSQRAVSTLFRGSIDSIGEAIDSVFSSNPTAGFTDAQLTELERKDDIDDLATLENGLSNAEDRLAEIRQRIIKQEEIVREADDLRFAASDRNESGYEENDYYQSNLKELKNLKNEAKNLEDIVDKAEDLSTSERKRLKLPPRIHRVRDEVKGTVVLSRADDKQIQPAIGKPVPEQAFALSPNGNGVNFLARFSRPGDPSHQSWVSGSVSVLSDNSAANRDGFSAQIAIGTAWKLNSKLAAAVEINAANGRYDIGATASTSDYRGVGATAGLAYKLAPKWTGQLIGFYNRAWVDTTLGTASGSYSAGVYGISARISGSFTAGDALIIPNVGLGYTWTSIGGFTDSAAVVVPGSQFGSGNVTASVRAEKTFRGNNKVANWTPFARIGVVHNFNQQNTFTFGPGITVTDSNTRGNMQIGVDVKFNNGAFLNISGNGSSGFDGGITSLGGNARLGIRF